MKNTVTFETAVRLKEAGFPQPVPDFGQTWLAEKETIILGGKSKAFPTRRLCVSDGSSDLVFTDEWISENMVFAPTATDILAELPDFFYIRKGTYNGNPIFTIFEERMPDVPSMLVSKWVDHNPHEAAALPYLETKNQK